MAVLFAIFGYFMQRTMPDISFTVFLINGLIPYFIFTNISNRSIKAIEANSGLFNYRPVKPIDTVFARMLLEVLIYTVVYIILMTVLAFIGESIDVHQILVLSLSWFFLIMFSCGVGLIFMVAGCTIKEMEKFIPILLKPLYFVSCIMFPLHSIPAEYRSYFLFNPIVHAVELSRESVVDGYSSSGVSIGYLAFCSVSVFFIGLALYRINEESMLSS